MTSKGLAINIKFFGQPMQLYMYLDFLKKNCRASLRRAALLGSLFGGIVDSCSCYKNNIFYLYIDVAVYAHISLSPPTSEATLVAPTEYNNNNNSILRLGGDYVANAT